MASGSVGHNLWQPWPWEGVRLKTSRTASRLLGHLLRLSKRHQQKIKFRYCKSTCFMAAWYRGHPTAVAGHVDTLDTIGQTCGLQSHQRFQFLEGGRFNSADLSAQGNAD